MLETQHIMTPVGADVSFSPSGVALFGHRLAESELFSDAFLARMLDSYPRHDLNVTTMGSDYEPGAWREGRVTEISGDEILRAIAHGHLWLNIKYLDKHSPEFAELLEELYEELGERVGCRAPKWRAATLLMSSPRAFVEYHADSIPNILWHVRGKKRVIVYPHDDPRITSPEEIERICSGEQDENMDYRADFESLAIALDLEPGRAVMWPQNAPHRVENREGLNISLSTEHLTRQAKVQVQVHRANRILRRWQLTPRSHGTRGVAVPAKRLLAFADRGLRKLRRAPRVGFSWPCTFRVDASSPTGFTDEP